MENALRSDGFVLGEPARACIALAFVDDERDDVSSTTSAWRERMRGIPIIAIGPRDYDAAVAALTHGATDYQGLPLDADALRATVLKHASPGPARNVRKTDLLVGDSAPIRTVLGDIERAASSDIPVLITGESGTGKELAARAIHYTGKRRQGPFIALNAGAIAESLLEAELFGSKRGAYTGADRDRPGVFVEAHGGTLLLDEIGTASHGFQVRLLRVLERCEVTPVGGGRPVAIDVRVIAATNVDAQRLLAEGTLRPDIYYRLAGVVIAMPPLRERLDDLPLIVAHHLALLAVRADQPVPRVASDALRKLARHDWPGNVRELVHVLASAMLRSRGGVLRAEHIELPDDATASSGCVLPFREARQQFEAEYVRRVLAAAGGSIAEAARLADRERKDFYELCRRAGVDANQFRARDSGSDVSKRDVRSTR